ncbi:hypothetical protein K439DRAFT_726951 [Ramaria rubella]|nr:hypothetical protein K439DRAFT_726951 [Ramaria rubella]
MFNLFSRIVQGQLTALGNISWGISNSCHPIVPCRRLGSRTALNTPKQALANVLLQRLFQQQFVHLPIMKCETVDSRVLNITDVDEAYEKIKHSLTGLQDHLSGIAVDAERMSAWMTQIQEYLVAFLPGTPLALPGTQGQVNQPC